MHKSLRFPSLLWLAALLLAACSQTPAAPAALESQAVLTVTSNLDSGDGTLRNAIAQAGSGDIITFASNVKTITLTSRLDIEKDLTIAGPEGSSVTISGNNSTGVFFVRPGMTVELRNLTITGGLGSGGGIYNDGTLNVTNSTIAGNSNGYYYVSYLNGAGIFNTGTLTLTNSTVSSNGNGVTYYGAGIYNTGTLTVMNSTVSDHGAVHYGGGIYNDGNLTVMNSTVSGNSALDGGGIYNLGTLTVTNSTVAGNRAGQGVGIYNGDTLNLSNSIIALNSNRDGNSDPDIYGSISSGSNNIVGGNPRLELDNAGKPKLADNGGSTKTIALLADSPALDAADSASCPATDQRGVERPQGSGCDIGAFELERVVTYNFDGFFSPVDNNLPNKAKAGQAIPLKWRLTDANGAPVTDLATVQVSVASLSCSLGPTPDAIEEYASGSSGLQNLGDGYYQYNWKTPKSYADSCKTLKLNLGDGITHTAQFQFTK